MRVSTLVLIGLLSQGCATGAQLSAQDPPDLEALDRLEADIEAGRLGGAREALGAWVAAGGEQTAEARGRVRYLTARLMADIDSARTEYLAVALDGRSSYGAQAWLRLAQMDLAVGEPRRAASDLERLRADFPGGPFAAESWYWTARTLEQRGLLDEACDTYGRAITAARRVEEPATIERAVAGSRECASGGLRFSIQVGAFSRAESARELRARLEADGLPARIFKDGGLHRVRVGWFASPETARGLERRLREGGFSVAVVAAES